MWPAVDLSRYRYFDAPTPLALAHRGGAKLPSNRGIENTAAAFRHAVDLGYRYIETDVHTSRDGVVFAFHDDSLDRLTGESGAIRDLAAQDVRRARIGDREPIPELADLLAEFPDTRFNIDLKADSSVVPTMDVLAAAGALDQVCLASFSHARLRLARSIAPGVATSFSPREVARLKLSPPWGPGPSGGVCVQVPRRRGRLTVVDSRFVARAHARGLQVHVWTIDDPAEMNELLDLGVDGIVSDRIDLLRDILLARGEWEGTT